MSVARSCDCPHSYPCCSCALGLTGDELLNASRMASSIAGWPSGRLDPDAVREHEERMAKARKPPKRGRATKPKRAKG